MLPMLRAAAASSGGAFTTQQAIDAGYTPGAIRHRLRVGLWVALRRGVYVQRALYDGCSGERERHALTMAAAVLAVGNASAAVGSHQSAAFLHGLDLPQSPALAFLTRPPDAPGLDRVRGIRLHRAALPAGHVRRAAGVPVTTVARTVVDLARTLPFGDAVVVADSALHVQATSPDELRQVLAECRRWPGSPQAGAVVRFADAAAESPLESMARVMFAEQGLPPPLAQAPIGEGRPFARVDFLWPGHGTIVETDGLAKYDQPDGLRLEKLRQERLEQLGYKVVRLTWEQVICEPERSAARVRQAFGAARRPVAAGE